MMVKVKKSEVIIDPEDREIISAADEKLKDLSSDEKEHINSIIENNLSHCNVIHPNPNVPTSIGKALEILLNSSAAVLLLNVISNPKHIKVTLDKLKEESLISENSSEFILELTAKYGEALHTLLLNIERPYDWARLNSDPLISGGILKLQSKIWRNDAEVFQFTSSLEDAVIIADHFVRKTLDAINATDKERILDLDKDRLDELEKRVAELKQLYESVKLEIEKVERKEELTTTN